MTLEETFYCEHWAPGGPLQLGRGVVVSVEFFMRLLST